MRNLNYQLKKLCRQSREGSYATQVKRERMLAGNWDMSGSRLR